jgi:hypothetical protein
VREVRKKGTVPSERSERVDCPLFSKEVSLMSWPYSILYRFLYSGGEKYTWLQVHILHETDKAILTTTPFCHSRESGNPVKIWIPKSRIYGIRLRKNIFEIYVKDL